MNAKFFKFVRFTVIISFFLSACTWNVLGVTISNEQPPASLEVQRLCLNAPDGAEVKVNDWKYQCDKVEPPADPNPPVGDPNPGPAPVVCNLGPIEQARMARLLSLDPVYRGQGLEVWSKSAGFTFNSIIGEARQPEEETFCQNTAENAVLISGMQVKTSGLVATWPACFTTDQSVSGGRSFRPDNFDAIANPSVLWTDNLPYTGTATIYGDCSNWPQLGQAPIVTYVAPAGDAPVRSTTDVISPTRLSMADLGSLGEIVQRLYFPEGILAGAQITFKQDWTAPEGWTVHLNGQVVTSVHAGETASVWSPESIRPLAEN